MARGRKPKKSAQRRGGHEPEVQEAAIMQNETLSKPMHIAANPLQSECWDTLIGSSPNFQKSDIPLLESYCFWYAVLRQAESQTITPDGRVITLYGSKGDDAQGSVRANPDIRTAEKATAMLMRLGDALNLSPIARDRAGLVKAMTKSTQMDIVSKTIEGYKRFQIEQKKALDAAK